MRLFAFSFFHYLVLKSTSGIFQRWKRTQFHEVRSERAQNTAWHDVTGNGNLHLPLNACYHFEEVDSLKKIESLRSWNPWGLPCRKEQNMKISKQNFLVKVQQNWNIKPSEAKVQGKGQQSNASKTVTALFSSCCCGVTQLSSATDRTFSASSCTKYFSA